LALGRGAFWGNIPLSVDYALDEKVLWYHFRLEFAIILILSTHNYWRVLNELETAHLLFEEDKLILFKLMTGELPW
jgi:hypothetical protein